jgi:type IV pilus assembly protein PilO
MVDIAQTGLAAGLSQKLFQPGAELKKDFYAELPIRIRFSGNYHQFGQFVSGIAALPRIVTLHDVEIKPDGKSGYDSLTLDVTAKTYRYLEEDELTGTDAGKNKDAHK